MKTLSTLSSIIIVSSSLLSANEAFQADLKKNIDPSEKAKKLTPKEALKEHSKASVQTADGQDELSADVQDLIQEQANPKVIELLDNAESLMGEATELLEKQDTSSNTIAIQTEIIEKIYEAAKEKQQQSQSQPGQPQPGNSPLMEMMQGMMGEGQTPGKQEGKGEGSGGEGNEGTSDQANDKTSGTANNTKEERRVPKNTSAPNQNLPKEEQRALDAYNK